MRNIWEIAKVNGGLNGEIHRYMGDVPFLSIWWLGAVNGTMVASIFLTTIRSQGA